MSAIDNQTTAEALRATCEKPLPPIVMIVGTGRSGTTLLEKALGNRDGAVAIGEASYLWERGMLENHRCSDGVPFRDHPTWKRILARAFPIPPDPRIQERHRHRVEHSRALPLLAIGFRRREVEAYRAIWRALFRAIAEETGARIVVDASKSPVRAWLLKRSGLDVRVVHVVRDLPGVIESWSKPKADPGSGTSLPTKHPVVVTMYWILHHLLSVALLGRKYYVRVDLGQFLDAPRQTVERIWERLDLEATGSDPFVTRRDFRVKPDLAFSGNPDRFHSGIISVRCESPRRTPPRAIIRFLDETARLWFRKLDRTRA